MRRALMIAGVLCLLPSAAAAEPWSLLRSENRHTRAGNEQLRAGDFAGAIESYDQAARELPSHAGVHLNRGLALLGAGKLDEARTAFELSVNPPAEQGLRADGYYNLGLALYRQGDAKAQAEDHKGAQALFRDAVEALRKSLTLRPGDRNTAWNYELARRRLREEEEKQKQKEQQEQEQEQNEQEQQDGEQQQDPQQDQQQQDQQQQDQPQDQQQKQDQQQQDQQQQDQPQDQQQQQDQQPAEQPLPAEAERALDALQDSEQNLERMRALQRANRERRQPEKDW